MKECGTIFINLLEASIPLSSTKVTNVKQLPLPIAALTGTEKVLIDWEEKEPSLKGLIHLIIYQCGQ